MRRGLFRTVVVAGVLIFGCRFAAGRDVAAERYRQAQVLLDDLEGVPQVELGEPQFLLVVDALKAVHRANPSSSYCDDALLAVGDIYAAMVGRFGPDPWRRKAVEAYGYLIKEYPHSRLLDKAFAAMKDLDHGVVVTLSNARRAPDPKEEEKEVAAAPQPAAPPPVPTAPADAIVQNVSVGAGAAPGPNRAAPSPASTSDEPASITAIRHYSHPDYTRIVIDADDYTPYVFDFLARPSRMYFDLLSARLAGEMRLGLELKVGDGQVTSIRAAQNRVNKARIVLDLAAEIYYDISWLSNPPRLVIDLRRQAPAPQTLARAETPAPKSEPPTQPAPTPEPVQSAAAVAAKPEPEKPQSFQEAFLALTAGRRPEPPPQRAVEAINEPPPAPSAERTTAAAQTELPRVVTDKVPQPREAPEADVTLAKAVAPPAAIPDNFSPPKAAEATSRGNQNLIRALGLKIGRVVIDAGHGGHDTGMIGPTGLREKDVVLDVGLRLGKLIESKLGAEVLYTREDDRFLELSDRPKAANDAKADLFISIHANAYSSPGVRGVETFYLNFTADPWALKVASRENAASSHTVHELQDLLGKIALKEKIDESREFALKMQGSLHSGLSKETAGLKNRGVRQAPLLVLIGAKMPAILTEIGFLSNPTDEKLFKSGAYRDKVAEHIFRGIESYVNTLSSHPLTMTETESTSATLD